MGCGVRKISRVDSNVRGREVTSLYFKAKNTTPFVNALCITISPASPLPTANFRLKTQETVILCVTQSRHRAPLASVLRQHMCMHMCMRMHICHAHMHIHAHDMYMSCACTCTCACCVLHMACPDCGVSCVASRSRHVVLLPRC